MAKYVLKTEETLISQIKDGNYIPVDSSELSQSDKAQDRKPPCT